MMSVRSLGCMSVRSLDDVGDVLGLSVVEFLDDVGEVLGLYVGGVLVRCRRGP